MFYLESKRTYLRRFNINDLNDLYDLVSNKNVAVNAGWKPYNTIIEVKNYLNYLMLDFNSLAIIDKKNNKVIGSISIYEDKKRENLECKAVGYALNESYWGKGIMSEVLGCFIEFVFKKTPIKMLTIYHFEFNKRSKRVIEKNKFVYEGTLRDSMLLYNNTLVDVCCYSLKREEYLNGK